MRNGAPILLGAGRAIQCPGAINQVGHEAKAFGRRALVVASQTPWEKFSAPLSASLEAAGVEFEHHLFTGYCSDANTSRIAENIRDTGAEMVIAMGGGRCLDGGKWSANKAGVRVITVPTSAATCAAYVSLCVLYDDTGSTLKSVFADNEVAAMLVDTDIIVDGCPSRMFASGIADALAKFPEMDFSMGHATNWERSILPWLGMEVSHFNMDRFFEQGLEALEAVKAGQKTALVEDILCANIMLTGLISCLASGGKQIAIAHSVYDCVCTLFKPQRKNFLHGEIVSCGIAVQMGINGYEEPVIERMVDFLKKLGTPTNIRDLGIEPSEENRLKIAEYIFSSMEIEEKEIRQRILDNLLRIF